MINVIIKWITVNRKLKIDVEEVNNINSQHKSPNLNYSILYHVDNGYISEIRHISELNVIVHHDGSFKKHRDENIVLSLYDRQENLKIDFPDDECPDSLTSFPVDNERKSAYVSDLLDKFRPENNKDICDSMELFTLCNENGPSIYPSEESVYAQCLDENEFSLLYSPKVPKSNSRVLVNSEDAIKAISAMGYECSDRNLSLLKQCGYDVERFVDEFQRSL